MKIAAALLAVVLLSSVAQAQAAQGAGGTVKIEKIKKTKHKKDSTKPAVMYTTPGSIRPGQPGPAGVK